MTMRQTPEQFFQTRRQVLTQEPVQVQQLPTESLQYTFEPNTALIILGLVAIVGLIGLFAILGSGDKKCR